MSLYQDPLVAILGAIQSLNGITLVANEYTYGLPTPVTEDAQGTNTSMLISALDSTTPYDGSVTIRYRRLPLSELLLLVPSTIQANGLVTTMDLALRLNQAYGTNFTTDDILLGPAVLTDGVGTVTLTAKDTSLGWIGSVTFTIAKGNYSIGTYALVTNLPGLYYPTDDPTKIFASIVSSYCGH